MGDGWLLIFRFIRLLSALVFHVQSIYSLINIIYKMVFDVNGYFLEYRIENIEYRSQERGSKS